MTASDIVRKVAQRAGLQVQGRRDDDAARPHHPGRRQRLGLPAPPGRRARPRAHADRRHAPVHDAARRRPRRRPAAPSRATTRSSSSAASTSCTCAARSPPAGQVPEVEVRGWDPAAEEGDRRRQSRPRPRAPCRTAASRPPSVAATFDSVPYVLGLRDPRAPGRRGRHRRRPSPTTSPAASPSWRGRRAATPRSGPAPPCSWSASASRSPGKYVLTSHPARVLAGARLPDELRARATPPSGRCTARPRGRAGSGRGSPAWSPRWSPTSRTPTSWAGSRSSSRGSPTPTSPWWARTVQPGAGKDRGAAGLPEVGDEVLVAFAQGDLEHPYVLGGLYNGMDKPTGRLGRARRRRPAPWCAAASSRGPAWCSSSSRRPARSQRGAQHQRRRAEGRADADRLEGHRDHLRGAVKVEAKQARRRHDRAAAT